AIAGAHRPSEGRVSFEDKDVTTMPAFERARRGIALVPEGRKLFGHMTVEENLRVAGAAHRDGRWTVNEVLDTFPLLAPLRDRKAALLSGGEQQATAIGRALMTNPKLLLLDEVSLGLAPTVVQTVYDSVARLIEGGTTIVLVEQDLGRALAVASRVICMLEGRLVLEGPAKSMTREQVTAAYFGLRSEAA